jgi:hypothetical protein
MLSAKRWLSVSLAVQMLAILSLASCAPRRDLRDGEPEICELHGVQLREDTVSIVYGLPFFDPEYVKAHKSAFPHSAKVVMGGCIVGREKRATVMYCPMCRGAEAEYSARHAAAR